ncbi:MULTISPECIES: DUF1987 domain-containing protein [Methylobacter]|jgi:Domain of unknown function (DUF1987).|uniref:Uncharacterized protein DUF1987 n=1 Tax=Methylobacter tundripaludum TaxID=173365 RepID=A0A2S6H9K7_9GAMM|nr:MULTISPECIES: DUF1987 domain-containing protein [Methylobacter]MDD4905347.1 DUF1987 domain-containing protein [Methylobacter tundripaludum]MDI1276602.1 DUF1987 domain-containing protein [Methylobacter sp.]MDI1357291.1 DUF1987 domain-containing protein [Methylobacter sp.]PPK74106.1 uncharacterized protein DUF1987 [Methylobacter tundripaludum]
MTDIYIPATSDTPEINFKFSSNTLSMSGEAYPENGVEFFRPILRQLQSHLTSLNGDAIEFNFQLTYFNSVSTKIFFSMFELLNEYAKAHPNCVLLNWHHDEDDDTILELGQDIQEDFTWIDFNAIVLA